MSEVGGKQLTTEGTEGAEGHSIGSEISLGDPRDDGIGCEG